MNLTLFAFSFLYRQNNVLFNQPKFDLAKEFEFEIDFYNLNLVYLIFCIKIKIL